MKEELVVRINEYLGNGGLFNPEMMDHEKVRDLFLAVRDYLSGKDASIRPLPPFKPGKILEGIPSEACKVPGENRYEYPG